MMAKKRNRYAGVVKTPPRSRRTRINWTAVASILFCVVCFGFLVWAIAQGGLS